MSKSMQTDSSILVVGQSQSEKLICNLGGLSYVPDLLKHQYGKSNRKPLEDWFLDELRFFQSNYPGYEIFTFGSSMVFGEKFITYLTICEFEIEKEEDFARLTQALKESDQAIRQKFLSMWEWNMASKKNKSILFAVGWLDFVYFLQHRNDFLDWKHGYYMSAFISDQGAINAAHFKILRDGSIVKFDETKLSQDDSEIYHNYGKIQYERVRGETLVSLFVLKKRAKANRRLTT